MPGGAEIQTRSPIRVLAPLVASQIAAGEVVERPASVVKELVENAIDAGAHRIIVELEQGGIELICVSDDGSGIPAAELPLALAAHATSKITASSDLEAIATKGFRGEALASITSVSRLSLRSRTAADLGASQIDAEGDSRPVIKPASGPVGTVVTVRNLFFNTPARRKFLRTPPTEQGRCTDVIKELAIAHPAIGFMLTLENGRTTIDLPPNQTPSERAMSVLGTELADQLLEISADSSDRLGDAHAGAISLWGLAGLPSIARASASAQYIALNGRIIKDRTIQHAIKEAYRGLIEPGRYPTAVLLIEMDPRGVDVNVHPAKTEVRFRDSSLVHSTVLRALRDALQRADLTSGYSQEWGRRAAPGSDPRAILPDSGQVQTRVDGRDFADAFKERFTTSPGTNQRIDFDAVRSAVSAATPAAAPPFAVPAHELPLVSIAPSTRPLQVHNSFLVTQDQQGMVIIDQHALHERVMFEKLLVRVTGLDEQGQPRRLESQPLLMPATLKADTRRLEALETARPLLERIGLLAAPIGPDAIGVHAFPTFLFERNVEVEPFLSEFLDRAAQDTFTPNSEAALHKVLDMMACKAAIKAGNALTDSEIADLMTARDAIERATSCPHGRPTSIRLTIRDLEKLFHRG